MKISGTSGKRSPSSSAGKVITRSFLIKRGVIPKTPQALKLEAAGPVVWITEMFPHLFKGKLELADHHKRLWWWYWNALLAKLHNRPFPGNYNAYPAIWSRGHSKSTHGRVLPIAEAAVVGSGYCLYTSGTQDLANGHVIEIEGLLDSEIVADFYPELPKPEKSSISNQSKSWKQDLLRLACGYTIQAIGLNVGVRGANKKGIRPSLIVPDDIDDKKDSEHVAKGKLDTLLSSVLPTKGPRTLFVLAQNLIHEHGVVNQITSGKVRALANSVPLEVIPAVYDIQTEEQTDPETGRIRDIIVAGTPSWPGYGLDRCQQDIDDYTLQVFNRECQHDLLGDRTGMMLKSWNKKIHVITWDEFSEMFGQRSIPRRWLRYLAHDWASTSSDYHACVDFFMAVAAQNSPMPGAFFIYEAHSYPEGTQADDVAMRIVKSVAPHVDWDTLFDDEIVREKLEAAAREKDMTRAVERRREVVAGVVKEKVEQEIKARPFQMMHMSHEAKTARSVYRNIYGLPFDPCNPGASGGVEELNHFMRVDYKTPHAFRPDVMGYTRFYVIVNELDGKGDENAELLQYQWDRWKWREPTLSVTGLLEEKPLKKLDDYGNAAMMLFVHQSLKAAQLSQEEKIEEALPEESKKEYIESLPDGEKSGAIMKRQMEIKRVETEMATKAIHSSHIRGKQKRRNARR